MEIFIIPNIYNILFYLVTLLWLLEVFVFKSRKGKADFEERRSFYLIALVIVISIAATISLTRFNLFVFREPLRTIIRYVGLIVYIGGVAFRYLARIYLGRHFSPHVRIETDHQLITGGLYRLYRHPLYVGLLLLVVGVTLYIGNWLTFILALVFMSYLLNRRMQHEEDLLLQRFGNPYQQYLEKSYRFIPFIY